MQLVCKVGTKYPDPEDPRHFTSWRDGQVIEDFDDGHVKLGTLASKHHCVIQIDPLDYWSLRGDTNWKSTKSTVLEHKKLLCSADLAGKYNWEVLDSGLHVPKRKRDFFVDYKWLVREGYITQGQYEDIYNQDKVADIKLSILDLMEILKHEDVDAHLDNIGLLKKGSVADGTYQVGTGGGADYATWTLAEADIAAQMTLNTDLTFEGQDEETAIANDVVFDTDTNGGTLILTAESGAEHNGGAYGNGARIAMGTYNSFTLDETSDGDLAKVEISKLAFDITGSDNDGIKGNNGCDTSLLMNRVLIAGSSGSDKGIEISSPCAFNVHVRNCIVYGCSTDRGISLTRSVGGGTLVCYNNTAIGCATNIYIDWSGSGACTMKNCLCQDGQTADYNLADLDISAKNYSEDATSPDSLQENFHDGTSNFLNYAAKDFRMAPGGDAIDTLKAGEDLTGTFTDDIDGDTRLAASFFIGADWISVAVGITGVLDGTAPGSIAGDFDGTVENIGTLDGAGPGTYAGGLIGVLENIGILDGLSPTPYDGSIAGVVENIGVLDGNAPAAVFGSIAGFMPTIGILAGVATVPYADINGLVVGFIGKKTINQYKMFFEYF